jgi:hypothetical protein
MLLQDSAQIMRSAKKNTPNDRLRSFFFASHETDVNLGGKTQNGNDKTKHMQRVEITVTSARHLRSHNPIVNNTPIIGIAFLLEIKNHRRTAYHT